MTINTQLISAAITGYIKKAEKALAAGANVNYVNSYGNTALILACEQRHTEMIRLLLNAGADVNYVNSYGATALTLTWTCQTGQTDVVRLLLNARADVNQANRYGSTALLLACQERSIETVRLLLNAGADVNHANQYGSTALLLACQKGSTETVRLLLAHPGIDIYCTTLDGETALSLAPNYKTIRLVVNHVVASIHDETLTRIYEENDNDKELNIYDIIKYLIKKIVNENHPADEINRLLKLLNFLLSAYNHNNKDLERKESRAFLSKTIKKRVDDIINTDDPETIRVEKEKMVLLRNGINILQKTKTVTKEKTAMKEIKALIVQLEIKRIALEKSMAASPANAAIYLTTADGTDRNQLTSYLLMTEMTTDQKNNLLNSLKELSIKQFDHLKQQLKDFVSLIKKDQTFLAEQGKLHGLFRKNNEDAYNANPFLFILRTGTSEYEQKDTKSFTDARGDLMGSAFMNGLKNFGAFMTRQATARSQDDVFNREDRDIFTL